MADSNIKHNIKTAQVGIDLDGSMNQIPNGKLTYALNALLENFDGNAISYQNEPGNKLCFEFPKNYLFNGGHFIPEKKKIVFFLVNPETNDSEIGYMDNNDCIYHTYINDPCLGFNVNYPILKVAHKITNCGTEIYWTDGLNSRRFLNLDEIPYKIKPGTDVCDNEFTNEIDCNKLNVQPIFDIPQIEIVDVVSGGNNTAGTLQFAIQYSDALGNPYTSYYSITNPLPLANTQITTPDFNYNVGKSVVLNISNIDISGRFEYYNLAVIKTINNIPSVELIGTYNIDTKEKQIIYSGQNVSQIRLTINNIFEKYPIYDIAGDLTTVQDVIVWDDLTSIERINYQKIANKISLQWETWRIPATEDYSDELNATNLRGHLRDEVYPYEIVFLLTKGKQTDGFHIPGRSIEPSDRGPGDVTSSNEDFIYETSSEPYWKIYNTAYITETNPAYTPNSNFKGSYQVGEFAYWESSELYPCDKDVWGELANTPIRHHKFPDVNISPIFENQQPDIDSDGKYTNLNMNNRAIFPIGVRINIQQIQSLIAQSDLTTKQKEEIVGFKIVRGNRDVNKSIVAKGIFRNVGKYEREGTEYYFPNYPYNDLREDPFILAQSNAYNSECNTYRITVTGDGQIQYTNCFENELTSQNVTNGEIIEICSITTPEFLSGTGTVSQIGYDTYEIKVFGNNNFAIFLYTDPDDNLQNISVSNFKPVIVNVKIGTKPSKIFPLLSISSTITQLPSTIVNNECYPENLNAFEGEESKSRMVFNSPETSFGQPFLGNYIKIDNILYGQGKGHFVEVEKNALYRLLTKEAQEDALQSSAEIADITSTFSATAMFTAYQAYLQIYINGITRKNYGWSYNSILKYNYYSPVENNIGIKQRIVDYSQYLYPGFQNINEEIDINNYQRESSVYVRLNDPLPFPSKSPSIIDGFGNSLIEDESRFTASQIDCSKPEEEFDIKSVLYYGAVKNIIPNQWGQIYSYETIDTGFQVIFDEIDYIQGDSPYRTIFGGDTFINKFSFKIKLPFFIDNRVGAPDDSDIYYDEIGNIAYPEYWHSARSVLYDYKGTSPTTPRFRNIISIKAHYFDCPNSQLPVPDPDATPPIVNPNRTFYDGKMYMFAYGIPTFYCESSINVDLRQAFNNKEGDFFPHVGSGIPDSWLQESNVPIVQDNTYYYNVTYSKQNEENLFTHLPPNWREEECFVKYPYKAIYSDQQQDFTDNKINSWLIYRPISYFDFPQNYGKLTSLDGIQNKAVLARFENKSLLYNTLLTINTSNPQAAYLGNSSLFKSSPPIDFAETDLGYVGSQHKFLLKIPQGQITVDAKRGQIFLISGNQATDISGFTSGLRLFLNKNLPFNILKYYPQVPIDNHFKGIGLHGVYDSKYDRIIITKLDYEPLTDLVKYNSENNYFYIEELINNVIFTRIIDIYDEEYFCNKSWTLSYNLNTGAWISFHSYIPNFYIPENNHFYSGLNKSCDLDIIAAEIVEPTTTTTTTREPNDCTLEATFEILTCELGGVAIQITTCDLEGEAIFISSTTTTTTTIAPTTTTSTTELTTTTSTTLP